MNALQLVVEAGRLFLVFPFLLALGAAGLCLWYHLRNRLEERRRALLVVYLSLAAGLPLTYLSSTGLR